jgi:hypothetical protein
MIMARKLLQISIVTFVAALGSVAVQAQDAPKATRSIVLDAAPAVLPAKGPQPAPAVASLESTPSKSGGGIVVEPAPPAASEGAVAKIEDRAPATPAPAPAAQIPAIAVTPPSTSAEQPPVAVAAAPAPVEPPAAKAAPANPVSTPVAPQVKQIIRAVPKRFVQEPRPYRPYYTYGYGYGYDYGRGYGFGGCH